MDEQKTPPFEGNKMNMSKEDAERWIKYAECVDRLKQNPDFQAVFEVYTRSEVLRSAYLLADENVALAKNKDQIRNGLMDNIMACGRFRNYIMFEVSRMRDLAQNTLESYKEEQ